MSKTSDWIRTKFLDTDLKRDAGLTRPDDVERFDNILYGEDQTWQLLDVYLPKNRSRDALPVIVSVHGGGWVYADKERYQFYCMDLARRGFAVVNFSYRLAPESKFPACLEDTNLVFRWVLEHAAEYAFDTDRVFAVGDSAGGHLLALYCAICTNSAFASRFSFRTPNGFVPKAIALNCGVLRIKVSDQTEDQFTTDLMSDLLPNQGTEEELVLVNSIPQITEAFPPCFVMTAENDFLKHDAKAMADALMAHNVPFLFRYWKSPARKLGHVFHLDIRCPESTLCNDEQCAFFRQFC